MKARILLANLLLAGILSACNLIAPAPATPTPTGTPLPATPIPPPTPLLDTPTPVPPPDTPTPTEPPLATPTPTKEPDPRPDEAILILEPGPGSQVASPVRVAGEADSTFEQTLVVRIVLVDGTELQEVPAMIQADLGERGPFEVDYEFTAEGQAFIQVYDVSARDGGIIHLASVGVTLAPGGPEDIRMADPRPEQIAIFQPQTGQTVSEGSVSVEGFGIATFEQTLIVEVYDEDTQVVGMEIVTLAGEMGEPAPFSVTVPYAVATAGPGRIVVRDESPAFGGDVHLSSVEVTLEP